MSDTKIYQALIQEIINQRDALETQIEVERVLMDAKQYQWHCGKLAGFNHILAYHQVLLAKDAH